MAIEAATGRRDTVVLFKGRPFAPESPDYVQAYWTPLALLSLAGPLRQAGFNVLVLDHRHSLAESHDRLAVLADRVIYVGVSALTGFEIHDALEFTSRVRAQWPALPIVWGGWHACSVPEQTLMDDRVDIVVTGLGQRLAVRIAERLSRGIRYFRDLPYTLSKDQWNTSPCPTDETPVDPMDLGDVALPAYDMLDLDWLRSNTVDLVRRKVARGLRITGFITYVTSFGCPFRCTYCANPNVFGSKWGGYSPDAVVKQIKWLAAKGFNWIEFIDAEFLVRRKRVERILEAIVADGIQIRWASQATVKAILQLEKHGLMPLLVESGCVSLSVGAESGSDSILGYIDKQQSADDVLEAGRILAKWNLEGSFNCLVGLPKAEKLQDIKDTFRLAYRLKKVNPEFTFPISFYTPLPGSKMFEDSVEAGFEAPQTLEDWGRYQTTYRVQADALPWRNLDYERLVYLVVTFFLPLAAPGNIRRGTIRNLGRHMREHPLRPLIWLAHKLACFRMEHQFFRFPLEYHLFKIWGRLTGYASYAPGMLVDEE